MEGNNRNTLTNCRLFQNSCPVVLCESGRTSALRANECRSTRGVTPLRQLRSPFAYKGVISNVTTKHILGVVKTLLVDNKYGVGVTSIRYGPYRLHARKLLQSNREKSQRKKKQLPSIYFNIFIFR